MWWPGIMAKRPAEMPEIPGTHKSLQFRPFREPRNGVIAPAQTGGNLPVWLAWPDGKKSCPLYGTKELSCAPCWQCSHAKAEGPAAPQIRQEFRSRHLV